MIASLGRTSGIALAGSVLLLSFVVSVGCGPPPNAALTGSVTFNGQPVEMGTISLEDPNGNTPTAEAAIVAGKYTVENVVPGNKRVKITGQRKTGKKTAVYAGDPNSPVIEETEPFIPAQFNDDSTLLYEVTTSTTKDFDLVPTGN